MSKSGQSSVTALNGRLSRKLRKSAQSASIDNGFKETLYGVCKDLKMDVVPSVKILPGDPQPWILQQDTMSSLDASISSKQSTGATSKKTSKQVIQPSQQASIQEIGPNISKNQEIQVIYPPTRTGIEALICKNFGMTDHILGAIQRTVGKFQTLRQLKFEFCRLTLDQLKAVKILLVQNPNIVDVSLNGNDVQREPYHILIKNTKILYLQLKFCKISDKATLRIKDPLHVITPQYLLTLNLSSNMITDAGAKHLAYALRTNRTLTHLNLSDNQLTDTGATVLMSVFRKFPLEHEEIVVRRQKNLHNLLLKEEIRYDLTKTRKGNISASGSKSEVTPKRSCSSARIRMAKGFDKSSTSSLVGNQRRRSSADSSRSLSSIIEDKLPKDPDPFMHECFPENKQVYCRGNFHLQYLNLSYNKITDEGLGFIKDTLREQQLTKVPDETETGLSKVVLEGNNIKKVDIVSSTSSISTNELGSVSRTSVKQKKSLLSKIII